jgi:hypothetical protein
MIAAEFDKVLDRRLHFIKETLGRKASEYASDADRMHNFKRAAGLTGETPLQALVGMWAKHLVSVMDLVDRHAKAGEVPSCVVVDEKIGDAINYLILLEGLFAELRTSFGPN